jgi:hypothetical protein
MLKLLVKNATLPDGRTEMSPAACAGLIVEATSGLDAPAHELIEAQGPLLSPALCGRPLSHGRHHKEETRHKGRVYLFNGEPLKLLRPQPA